MTDLLPKPLSEPLEFGYTAARRAESDLKVAISNALVRLHKREYGKGPTKARVDLIGDLVICRFEGGFLTHEKTLAGAGHRALVAQYRTTLAAVLRNASIEAVESVLMRRVRSFLTTSDVEANISVAIFVLEPNEQPSAGSPP